MDKQVKILHWKRLFSGNKKCLNLRRTNVALLSIIITLNSSICVAIETGVAEALSKISGVYLYVYTSLGYQIPCILSVHVNGDSIGIIDISDNLKFLALMHYISPEEYQQNIKLSIAERTFIGQVDTNSSPSSTFIAASLKPLLPEGLERLKKYCPTYLTHPCNSLFPGFSINQATGEVTATFSYDTGSIFFYYNFTKIF